VFGRRWPFTGVKYSVKPFVGSCSNCKRQPGHRFDRRHSQNSLWRSSKCSSPRKSSFQFPSIVFPQSPRAVTIVSGNCCSLGVFGHQVSPPVLAASSRLRQIAERQHPSLRYPAFRPPADLNIRRHRGLGRLRRHRCFIFWLGSGNRKPPSNIIARISGRDLFSRDLAFRTWVIFLPDETSCRIVSSFSASSVPPRSANCR